MLDLFKATLRSKLDGKSNIKMLLAISGGMDSMVMLHMFQRCEWPIIVAHVDHGTRSGQSNADAKFVEKYCQDADIEFYRSTINDGDLPGKNFQSEARDFRYCYFRELALQESTNYIVTAHHKDDRWETFVQALSKSAGLDGLSSLRYVDKDLLRPMLVFSRAQIETYSRNYNVPFVHDESNDSNDYTRNKIRHIITPTVQTVFPDIVEGASSAAANLNEEKQLIEELIDRSQFVKNNNGYVSVDRIKVNTFKSKETLMSRLVGVYGFTRSDAADMLKAQTGSIFQNDMYEGLADRGNILIRDKVEKLDNESPITVAGIGEFNYSGRTVNISHSEDAKSKHLILDKGLLLTPLVLRRWQSGDAMKPSGMGGKTKKVKDILTDMKLSKWEKDKTLLLISNDQIIQIIGHRSAEGYISEEGILISITS